MKPLNELSNTERAMLLHQLFPEAIPAFLDFATGMSQTIREDEAGQRANWTMEIVSFDFWLTLADTAGKQINKYGRQLHNSSKVFAEQLFDGYLAMYMVHCLTVYTTVRQHPNRKFTLAVDLLFNA